MNATDRESSTGDGQSVQDEATFPSHVSLTKATFHASALSAGTLTTSLEIVRKHKKVLAD